MLPNLVELDIAQLLIRERLQSAAREALAAEAARVQPEPRQRWVFKWNWR